MPYIAQEKRDVLDSHIKRLVDALLYLKREDRDNVMVGNINYVFTKLLAGVYSSPRYEDINSIVGVCQCVALEYYRRIAAPYEDMKIESNGDVYPCASK